MQHFYSLPVIQRVLFLHDLNRMSWKLFGNKSADKETLMANMGLPENDSDSEVKDQS